jgi:putative heme-binding domain-containing protein
LRSGRLNAHNDPPVPDLALGSLAQQGHRGGIVTIHFRTSAIALTVVVTAWAPATVAAQTPGDIEAGKTLFNGLCVTCHGFEGAGQMAPPLNRPRLRLAATDAALREIIAEGIPNSGMPRVRRTTENELRQLMAYVRSLGQRPRPPVRGEAAAGRQLYGKLGCAVCHVIDGQGGTAGPALTDIGAMRGADYLRQSIVDPASELPRGTLPVPARGYVEYLPVTVVTRDGREVQGVRLNEDAFTIQLRDAKGGFHSIRKSEAELVRKEVGKSLMPSFKGLSDADLDNLVAYLSTLGGAR